MTLAETALQLGKSEVTLKKNFARTQKTLAKKGIIVTKWGRGKDAEYEIEYEERDKDEEE